MGSATLGGRRLLPRDLAVQVHQTFAWPITAHTCPLPGAAQRSTDHQDHPFKSRGLETPAILLLCPKSQCLPMKSEFPRFLKSEFICMRCSFGPFPSTPSAGFGRFCPELTYSTGLKNGSMDTFHRVCLWNYFPISEVFTTISKAHCGHCHVCPTLGEGFAGFSQLLQLRFEVGFTVSTLENPKRGTAIPSNPSEFTQLGSVPGVSDSRAQCLLLLLL